jgi:hypothetical protein
LNQKLSYLNIFLEPGTWQSYALAATLVALGLSFAWKFIQASIFGKVTYWTGFLPFTLISPFLIHLPSKKGSLIREAQGMWVYAIMAPSFFVLSILSIEAGCDIAGLPGTDTINWVVNRGDSLKAPAIVFDKTHFRYSFPMLARDGKLVMEKINKYNVQMADKDKLLKDSP